MPDNDDLVEAWRALAARFRHRRDEAEDYLQDAVVAALDERRRTGAAPTAAGAWLRTVARRREVDHIRRAQYERRIVPYAEELDADVAQEVADRQEAYWLAGHVDSLPAKTRDVVRALAAGHTQGDVATELGLTPRAVEGHVRRARIALRRALDRAGAIVPAGFLRRRWRRLLPLGAAGVATAVGIAMMGTPDTAMLIPVPNPKPQVDADRDHKPPPTGGLAFVRSGYTATRAARLATGRRDVPEHASATQKPAPPSDTPPPDPGPVEPPQLLVANSYGAETNGDAVASSTPTIAGAWYEVTVSGAYSYNGRDSLADCGHWQPEDKNHEWETYTSVYQDDVVAECMSMPVNPLHVYTWRFRGTGEIVKFRIHDDGGCQDNVGRLAISVKRVKTG